MSRAIVLMLDSLGIGAAPDAGDFGDEGANTLASIAACRARAGDDLHLPHLARLGLGAALEGASGVRVDALMPQTGDPASLWGWAAERSRGKDTPSGHWEMAGVPVLFNWGYFPDPENSFPPELIAALTERAGLPGVLGCCHASGTEIIARLGEEHVRTGKPIVYTSADSVFQIAAHEKHFGLGRLYETCLIARRLVDEYNIGRVIARPFVGETASGFRRTGNRRDYAVPPPAPTLLDRLQGAGHEVIAIGKISDIYAHCGISRSIKADGNAALFDATLAAVEEASQGALVFTNFVDFDMLYGHRRDAEGYARALEDFDRRLPELEALLQKDDMVVITADHGCDPCFVGTDHTREYVPAILFGPAVVAGAVGRRDSFADIGQTIAAHLGIAPLDHGKAMM